MDFVFVGGNLALDFAGTLKWRRTRPEELLRTPGDLARWSVEAGVLTGEPSLGAEDLRTLLGLREAVYRLVAAALDGRPWPGEDLGVLNRAASAVPPRLTLGPGGLAREGGAAEIGAEVARSAATLLAQMSAGVSSAGSPVRVPVRVRECARTECTRLFVDRSRGGTRHWCGMEECGNRVKAASYRSRKKG
ncbi:ABATE domain-containing protein [Microbispora sp. NPDC046973]|uniref:CGNR zinc finger domain-containing protein n=1 Tax=Microbispora sp. NPDC046973 TaxID=3155022 RepID=UPI0033DB7E64